MFQKKAGYIGVNFGTTALRIAQVANPRQLDQLIYACRLPYETPINLTELQRNDYVSVKSALSSITALVYDCRDQFIGNEVALCIPASMCTLQHMRLPDASPTELRSMVEEVLATESPELVDPRFGLWTSPKYNPKPDSDIEVTCVSVPSALVDEVTEAVWQMGLEPVIVDVQYCALARAADIANPTKTAQVIVDVGRTSTTVVISCNNEPKYARLLRGLGLEHCLQLVSQSFHLSLEESFVLVQQTGIDSSSNDGSELRTAISDVLSDGLVDLVEAISNTLNYSKNRLPQPLPDRVVLSGAAAQIPGLAKWLSKRMGKTVHPWKPAAMTDPDANERWSPAFASAVSMSALRMEAAKCT